MNKPVFEVGEKVEFSQRSIDQANGGKWNVNPTQIVQRGWAIIERVSGDEEEWKYHLYDSHHSWFGFELKKIENNLPEDLFEL